MSKIKRFLLCLPLFCVSLVLFVLLLNSSTGEYYQKADRQDNIKKISGFALNAKVVTAKEAAVQIAAGIPTAEKSEQPAIKPTEQPTEETIKTSIKPTVEPTLEVTLEPTPKPTPEHCCDFVLKNETESTCTKEGKSVYECACGKVKNVFAAKKEHDFKYVSMKDSTKTSEGYYLYSCTVCKTNKTVTIAKKPNASYTDKCGDSLLGKTVPGFSNNGVVAKLINMFNTCSQSEVNASNAVKLTGNMNWQEFMDDFQVDYQYLSYYMTVSVFMEDGEYYLYSYYDKEANETLQKCYERVDSILAELKINKNTTQRDAIKRISNWLCEQKQYQYTGTKDNSPLYSIMGNKGTCNNYSIAFQMLCLGAGIECSYYMSNTMNHSWNEVYFSDGTALWVDSCWNDAIDKNSRGEIIDISVENGYAAEKVDRYRSRYLLIDTQTLLKNHTL